MRHNYMYCYFDQKRRCPYSGIVGSEDKAEALQRIQKIKGDLIYPGTLMVEELADSVQVNTRVRVSNTKVKNMTLEGRTLKDVRKECLRKGLLFSVVIIKRDGSGYISGTLNYYKRVYGDAIWESEIEFISKMNPVVAEVYIREPMTEGERMAAEYPVKAGDVV